MGLAITLMMSGLAFGDWGDISIDQHHGWFGDNKGQIAQQKEFGPYEVDVYQKSFLLGNQVTIGQKGEYIKAKVDQTAGGMNNATICQIGDNLRAKVEQQSALGNCAIVHQEGSNGKVKIEQNANGFFGWNTAHIEQYAIESKIKIQQDGSRNEADVLQTGSFSEIKVKQEATSYNKLDIDQIGSGSHNKINLIQEATGRSCCCCGPSGGYNEADIEQHGSCNKLVGACTEEFQCSACPGITGTKAVVRGCKPAIQTGLYNELDLYQSGCGNTVGLYQNAPNGYNKADITQTGCRNTLAVYQDNPTGNNIVEVEQTGGQEAYIYQGFGYGDGSIYVYQGT
jgi:hypothetical protein